MKRTSVLLHKVPDGTVRASKHFSYSKSSPVALLNTNHVSVNATYIHQERGHMFRLKMMAIVRSELKDTKRGLIKTVIGELIIYHINKHTL